MHKIAIQFFQRRTRKVSESIKAHACPHRIMHIAFYQGVACANCRQLALKYHPDKAGNAGQRAASNKLFKLISNAHSVLADRDQRRMFDMTMLRRQMHAKGRHAM